MSYRIRRLKADETLRAAPALGVVLKDCVDGGASVSFMADLTLDEATAFWEGAASAQRGDGRAVLVAEDDDGVFGVVQVIAAGMLNQPHRGDVAKMLVHRRGRRRGAAEALLAAAEQARAAAAARVLPFAPRPDRPDAAREVVHAVDRVAVAA